MVPGLIGAIVLARGLVIKAIGMAIFGFLLGLIGTDVSSGAQRFTFDIVDLFNGLDFVVVAMGVFGVTEIIINLESAEEQRQSYTTSVIRYPSSCLQRGA